MNTINAILKRIIQEWHEYKRWIVILLIVAVTFGYYAKWKLDKPPVYVKVPEIKEVIKYKIKRVEVPIESGKVVVLDKKEVVKRIPGLPEGFADDPKKQVTSTADLPPSKSGHDVLNIINTESGESEIFAKERKLSFFGFESKREVGARAGLSDAGRQVDIYLQQDVARIGTFHLSGYLEGSYKPDVDDKAGWKAMAVLYKEF